MDPREDLKAFRLFLVDPAVTERGCGAGFEVSCVAERWRGLQKYFEAFVLGNTRVRENTRAKASMSS
jgi:hypothetical protein